VSVAAEGQGAPLAVPRASTALALGLVTLLLVGTACLLAWRAESPLVPEDGGRPSGVATGFLVLLLAAFAAYLAALLLLRRGHAALKPVVVLAVAIQLAPLASPLLLSTDAWTYWAYGRIAAVEDGNPYTDPPSAFADSPAFGVMGERWRDTTSVYGPAFTLASEPIAAAVGDSDEAAAWSYKALAAAAVVAATLLVARVARQRALAAAFVGWNPLLAVHLAGGGHNDAWLGALLAAALALAAARRAQAAGAVWAFATAVKWVPLVFFVLAGLQARARGRGAGLAGFACSAVVIAAAATWAYGLGWLEAVVPLLENAELETSYALPSRLEQAGLPEAAALSLAAAALVGGLVLLARAAARGRPVLGRAAVLVLMTTPYLAVWYLGWALPLAAAEEDRWGRLGCLVFCAYLLPQTIPL
jgi:Glycosyltransferase family 87